MLLIPLSHLQVLMSSWWTMQVSSKGSPWASGYSSYGKGSFDSYQQLHFGTTSNISLKSGTQTILPSKKLPFRNDSKIIPCFDFLFFSPLPFTSASFFPIIHTFDLVIFQLRIYPVFMGLSGCVRLWVCSVESDCRALCSRRDVTGLWVATKLTGRQPWEGQDELKGLRNLWGRLAWMSLGGTWDGSVKGIELGPLISAEWSNTRLFHWGISMSILPLHKPFLSCGLELLKCG